MSGRCPSCNRRLSEYELTRKDEHGRYIDLCTRCENDSLDFEVLDEDEPEEGEES